MVERSTPAVLAPAGAVGAAALLLLLLALLLPCPPAFAQAGEACRPGGTVDETNATVGLARQHSTDAFIQVAFAAQQEVSDG